MASIQYLPDPTLQNFGYREKKAAKREKKKEKTKLQKQNKAIFIEKKKKKKRKEGTMKQWWINQTEDDPDRTAKKVEAFERLKPTTFMLMLPCSNSKQVSVCRR